MFNGTSGELRQFIETFQSNRTFAGLAIGAFGLVIYLNYFSGWSFQRYITRSKKTLNYLYLIIVILNLVWIYLKLSPGSRQLPTATTTATTTSTAKPVTSTAVATPTTSIHASVNDNLFGKEEKLSLDKRLPTTSTNQILGDRKTVRNVSNCKKKTVAARQSWKCGLCGQLLDETYEVDHIVPLYQGGTNELDNLMALDPICHKKKTFQQQYL